MTWIALYSLTSLAFWENSKYILSALVLSQKASLEVQCCLVHEKQTNKQRLSCVKTEKVRGKSPDSKNSWLPPFQKLGKRLSSPKSLTKTLGRRQPQWLAFPQPCASSPKVTPHPSHTRREKGLSKGPQHGHVSPPRKAFQPLLFVLLTEMKPSLTRPVGCFPPWPELTVPGHCPPVLSCGAMSSWNPSFLGCLFMCLEFPAPWKLLEVPGLRGCHVPIEHCALDATPFPWYTVIAFRLGLIRAPASLRTACDSWGGWALRPAFHEPLRSSSHTGLHSAPCCPTLGPESCPGQVSWLLLCLMRSLSHWTPGPWRPSAHWQISSNTPQTTARPTATLHKCLMSIWMNEWMNETAV